MKFSRIRTGRLGLWLGPVSALAAAVLLPDFYRDALGDEIAFGDTGRYTAALALWMAVWWMTEAIPVYATALLPLGLFPLCGVATLREAASPYGHELIFLFLGGLLLALSMQRWGLDRRMALTVVRFFGTRASLLVLGFMALAAGMSMWVSNTATTLALYPVALSVLTMARPRMEENRYRNLSQALLLGVAYAASIGGLGTLIGSPPNLILAGYAKDNLGLEIGFARWMIMAMPLVCLFLPLAWLVLIRMFPLRGLRLEGAGDMARGALRDMGNWNRGEKATATVFFSAVFLWVFQPLLSGISLGGLRPFSGLTDTGIAVLAALVLFLIPAPEKARDSGQRGRGGVLNWETAGKVPYGILILFGGGLSLASAMQRNGVGEFLGGALAGLQTLPMVLFTACAVLGVLFLTELTSNTATAATLIPVLAALAGAAGWEPLHLLIPAVLASSCAFMLPVATPPNAIAYASGEVDAASMVRAGFPLNLLGAALILLAVYALLGWTLPAGC